MSIGSRQRLNDIQIEPKIKLGDTEVNKVSKTKTCMWCIVCIACMLCIACMVCILCMACILCIACMECILCMACRGV